MKQRFGIVAAMVVCVGLILVYRVAGPKKMRPTVKPARLTMPLFPVVQNGRWGYIDSSGKMIIPPTFSSASNFSDGLALVDKSFIDTQGKVILSSTTFADQGMGPMGDFTEGLVLIKKFWDAGSRPGRLPDPRTTAFSATGLASFGYMNTAGQIVINPEYSEGRPFSDGLAAVRVKEGSFGFIDTSGKMIIFPQFYRLENFGEGLGAVAFDNRWGFIDRTGTVIIKPRYGHAYGFAESLARVAETTSGRIRWGYIDKTDTQVIPLIYEDADDFSEGLAAVKESDRWGFITKNGQWVIRPSFGEKPNKFKSGLAQVHQGNQVGYIDQSGRFVWPFSG